MTAREAKTAMLADCAQAAQGARVARDQRQAHVYRLAGMVVQSRYPLQAKVLMCAADGYFAKHPEQLLPSQEVLKRGWVISLPRLRDALSVRLRDKSLG